MGAENCSLAGWGLRTGELKLYRRRGHVGPGAWRGVTLNLAHLQGSPGLEGNFFWGPSGELAPLACSVSAPASSSSG